MGELRAPGDVAREVAQQLAEAAGRRRAALLGVRPEIGGDMGPAVRLGLARRDVARDVAVTDADVELGEPFPALSCEPALAGRPEYL